MALDRAGARVPESHARSCSFCCLLWHQAQSPQLAPHPFEEEVVGRINRQCCMHSLLNHWETALERWTLLPHRHCQRYLWLQLNQMSVPPSRPLLLFSSSPTRSGTATCTALLLHGWESSLCMLQWHGSWIGANSTWNSTPCSEFLWPRMPCVHHAFP